MNYPSIYTFMESGDAFSANTATALQSLIEKYPWFEGAQVLYALHKHKYDNANAAQQLHKAQLYMHNPLWLNWQISRMDHRSSSPADVENSQHNTQIENQSSEEISLTANTTTIASTADSEETLRFDPLYTIDYFASQGIRLKQDQLGNDQLSQQVKTFTQWLKTMKRIYHEAPPASPPIEDKKVEEMADASNRNEEIFTETMAEVLIHQGKKRQAIAVYEKLSLLHPEKSSYFTSRISEIKD